MGEDEKVHCQGEAMIRAGMKAGREILRQGKWKWWMPWNWRTYFYLKGIAGKEKK